jgi:sugar phosphate isomerase/epimerase
MQTFGGAVTLSAESWPIGAALLQFPSTTRLGLCYQDAPVEQWSAVLREVALAGFDHVDLTDSWLRPGDLSPDRLENLIRALKDNGLGVTAISSIRKSVIDPDPEVSASNLAYTLRNVDAAAQIGTAVLSVGLHRPLTSAQQAAQWFWTEQGESDPVGDDRTWALAVERLRAVGSYAAKAGINISLEMYEDTYLGTADSAVALVTDIDLPNVGLNPDIGNLIRLHRPIENWEDMHLKTCRTPITGTSRTTSVTTTRRLARTSHRPLPPNPVTSTIDGRSRSRWRAVSRPRSVWSTTAVMGSVSLPATGITCATSSP